MSNDHRINDLDTASIEHPTLHIVCDWDVGLFNLLLGVLSHTYWAITEGRIPIIYYGNKNCYWTPKGYRGRNTVWEYYFEPVIPEYPVSRIPPYVVEWIANNTLERSHPGQFIDEFTFVSRSGAWHITVEGEGLRGPRGHLPSSRKLRQVASALIQTYIRPRDYIRDKADHFFRKKMDGHYVIGVHIRGTDAIGDPGRQAAQTSVNYDKFVAVLRDLIKTNPDAMIFVASDEQDSVDRIQNAFANVVTYDSVRHLSGEAAGWGPAGGLMPAYLTLDPDRAAQNGEDAVIDYMLLCRSNYLVHNYSSIPRAVLLTVPGMPDTNVDSDESSR